MHVSLSVYIEGEIERERDMHRCRDDTYVCE